ncbi:hypothetical protein CDAR_530121 [Caerostris darwini]|uniref:Uncharacterized protein n=1 Tax=Caerostris darwini TaxID=1538125 RepID=A0AAV4S2F1_9ARAC|nr:hypothetical protein CDAR_530121 [Caerostris darwini]
MCSANETANGVHHLSNALFSASSSTFRNQKTLSRQHGNGLVAFPVTFARLHDFGDNFQITVKSEGDRFDFFAKFKYTVKSVLKFSNQDV